MSQTIHEVTSIELKVLRSLPPKLHIHVKGNVSSSDWKNPELVPYVYIQPPLDGIYDFDFVADAPDGIVLQVISEIEATYIWDAFPENLKGVRIHAANNVLEQLLTPNEEPTKGEPVKK